MDSLNTAIVKIYNRKQCTMIIINYFILLSGALYGYKNDKYIHIQQKRKKPLNCDWLYIQYYNFINGY